MQIIKKTTFKIWSQLPFKLRNNIDIIRRYSYWNKTGIIFIHIPKTAGVSINYALYGKTLGHFEISQIRKIYPNLVQSCFSFAVVRNPMSRLISSYHFAKSGGTRFMKISNPQLYQSKYFNSFNQFVKDWLRFQDLNQLDGVFKPQINYLNDNGTILTNQFIQLEKIFNNTIVLQNTNNTVLKINHYNSNSFRENFEIKSQTEDLVKDLYFQDYQLLDYPH